MFCRVLPWFNIFVVFMLPRYRALNIVRYWIQVGLVLRVYTRTRRLRDGCECHEGSMMSYLGSGHHEYWSIEFSYAIVNVSTSMI